MPSVSPLDKMAARARNLAQNLGQSRFIRDVMWLTSGTGIAQMIALAILPVLSRLYSPEDFGLLALYISIVTLLSLFTSFSYELMIMQSRSHHSASQLVWLILAIGICTTGAALVIVGLFRHQIATTIGTPQVAAWLWTVPILLMQTSIYRAFRYWKLRMQQFSIISQSLILRALVFASVSTMMGFTGVATDFPGGGLIIAFVFSEIAKTLVIMGPGKGEREKWATPNLKRIAAVGRRNWATAGTVSLSFSMSLLYDRLPYFMINSFFSATSLGFYSVVQRICAAPALLVAQAINDVFRQRASEQQRKQGHFGLLTLKISGAALLISLVPYSLAIAFAPTIFSIFLGPDWELAGTYASIIMVGEFLAFVTATIAFSALIVNDKRFIFFWTLARLLLTLGLIPMLYLELLDFTGFLWALVGIRVLMVSIEAAADLMCAVTGRPVTEPPYPWKELTQSKKALLTRLRPAE